MLIECLINNTTKGEAGGDNQFFVDAEQLLYSACIFYLKDFCYDDSKKNFAGVMSMINASSVNEMDPNSKSPLDLLFDELPHNSLAWKYYKAFKQAAGKTLKSIIISCVTRLQPFLIPQVVNLTKTDGLHLEKMGRKRPHCSSSHRRQTGRIPSWHPCCTTSFLKHCISWQRKRKRKLEARCWTSRSVV